MLCYKFGTFLVTNYFGFVTSLPSRLHFGFCYKFILAEKNVTSGL